MITGRPLSIIISLTLFILVLFSVGPPASAETTAEVRVVLDDPESARVIITNRMTGFDAQFERLAMDMVSLGTDDADLAPYEQHGEIASDGVVTAGEVRYYEDMVAGGLEEEFTGSRLQDLRLNDINGLFKSVSVEIIGGEGDASANGTLERKTKLQVTFGGADTCSNSATLIFTDTAGSDGQVEIELPQGDTIQTVTGLTSEEIDGNKVSGSLQGTTPVAVTFRKGAAGWGDCGDEDEPFLFGILERENRRLCMLIGLIIIAVIAAAAGGYAHSRGKKGEKRREEYERKQEEERKRRAAMMGGPRPMPRGPGPGGHPYARGGYGYDSPGYRQGPYGGPGYGGPDHGGLGYGGPDHGGLGYGGPDHGGLGYGGPDHGGRGYGGPDHGGRGYGGPDHGGRGYGGGPGAAPGPGPGAPPSSEGSEPRAGGTTPGPSAETPAPSTAPPPDPPTPKPGPVAGALEPAPRPGPAEGASRKSPGPETGGPVAKPHPAGPALPFAPETPVEGTGPPERRPGAQLHSGGTTPSGGAPRKRPDGAVPYQKAGGDAPLGTMPEGD